MPKVSAKQVQRRIVALDAQYTVAQPKRPGRRVLAVIILAIIAVAAFSSAHRTSSDFSRLTLKHGLQRLPCGEQPQPNLNAANEGDGHSQGRCPRHHPLCIHRHLRHGS